MRSSVSIRGGRPPDSSRAIADCVVAGQLGQLLLGKPEGLPLLGDLLRDAREEPALVGVDVGEPFAKPFESIRSHISRLL